MNYLKLLLLFISFSLPSFIYAENEKVEIPTEDKWGDSFGDINGTYKYYYVIIHVHFID